MDFKKMKTTRLKKYLRQIIVEMRRRKEVPDLDPKLNIRDVI